MWREEGLLDAWRDMEWVSEAHTYKDWHSWWAHMGHVPTDVSVAVDKWVAQARVSQHALWKLVKNTAKVLLQSTWKHWEQRNETKKKWEEEEKM